MPFLLALHSALLLSKNKDRTPRAISWGQSCHCCNAGCISWKHHAGGEVVGINNVNGFFTHVVLPKQSRRQSRMATTLGCASVQASGHCSAFNAFGRVQNSLCRTDGSPDWPWCTGYLPDLTVIQAAMKQDRLRWHRLMRWHRLSSQLFCQKRQTLMFNPHHRTPTTNTTQDT